MMNGVKPTEKQIHNMILMDGLTAAYAKNIEIMVPDGPDRAYVLGKLREVAIWINIAITGGPDGAPRL